MKATELRIGNLVYGINRRTEVHLPVTLPLKVLEIGIFNSEVLPHDKNPAQEEAWIKLSNTDISPIPLTRDWLAGFEFKNGLDRDNYFFKTHGFDFMIEHDFKINKFSLEIFTGDEWHRIVNDIDFVHELQNLWFALTNKELEFKPPTP